MGHLQWWTILQSGAIYSNWAFEKQTAGLEQLIFALLNLSLDLNMYRVTALLASAVWMMENTERLPAVEAND